jgi:hypothetical protein
VTKIQNYSGANPTIASYNVSVVNIYNAIGSLVRLKNIFFYLKNAQFSLLHRYNAGVVVVNLKVVGLDPGSQIVTAKKMLAWLCYPVAKGDLSSRDKCKMRPTYLAMAQHKKILRLKLENCVS